jgi:uncharacterized protein
MTRPSFTLALAVGMAASLVSAPLSVTLHAAEPPLELHWKDLVPPIQPTATKPKPFFAGATPKTDNNDTGPPPPPTTEGRWMSTPSTKTPTPTPIVAALDGKTVRIGGYIVPLDFEQTKVKEFLLVPFVGACIHVPPPPANQIIYVKVEKGFEVGGTFDPVTVTGKLAVSQTFTGLAETGYSINADTVAARTP